MKRTIQWAISILLSLWICIFSGVEVLAQEKKNVTLFVSPYAWLINLSGDIGARGYTAKVSESFHALTEHLSYAGMLAIDAVAYDTVGLTGNINIAKLTNSGAVRGISLDGKSRMLLSDLALFYRAGSTPLTDNSSAYILWDIFAGGRLWDLHAKLNVNQGPFHLMASQHETWLDPIVGIRAWVHFSDKWNLELRGDIGGFNTNSKLTWSASSIVAHSLWKKSRLLIGYRAVGVDYEKDSNNNKFRSNIVMHGPVVGLSFRF